MTADVAIIMGSRSDYETMAPAATQLDEFDIAYEMTVVSAHRTPQRMFDFARVAADNGYRVIIAGAGGAAHLPGMVAALTPLPVIGVPVGVTALKGVDALHSIVQMPAGVPVATVAIDGARNAAVLAARILGAHDLNVRERVEAFAAAQAEKVQQQISEVETMQLQKGKSS